MAESAIQSLPLTEEAISARLERLPLTSWYRRIMLIVGMAGFFDAFDALTIAFVLPVLIPLWHIEPGRIGALISIGYVGQLIGALGLSWMAERFGRLSVLRWSIAIYALFNLACAFAWSYDSLFWLRFVQGLGLGAEVPIAATYMNEFTRAELRGRLVLLFQAIFAFGVMITALVAIWVVPNLGWQWMFVIGALPALLAVALRRLVPESPRWLAAHGRLQEADQTLTRIEDSVVKDGVQPIPPLPSNIPSIVKETGALAGPVRPRLSAPNANRLGNGVHHVDCRLWPACLAADDLSQRLSPANQSKPAIQLCKLFCRAVRRAVRHALD